MGKIVLGNIGMLPFGKPVDRSVDEEDKPRRSASLLPSLLFL
jgi:hypothetical protein